MIEGKSKKEKVKSSAIPIFAFCLLPFAFAAGAAL
jgi:hypothetical protein